MMMLRPIYTKKLDLRRLPEILKKVWRILQAPPKDFIIERPANYARVRRGLEELGYLPSKRRILVATIKSR